MRNQSPEQIARDNIDRMLINAGWVIQDFKELNLSAGLGMNLDYLEGSALSGEREILDGTLQLCVRQPDNKTARMLFIQTLQQMKKPRPDILSEFKDKVELLQNENPIHGTIGDLAAPAIAEVFAI